MTYPTQEELRALAARMDPNAPGEALARAVDEWLAAANRRHEALMAVPGVRTAADRMRDVMMRRDAGEMSAEDAGAALDALEAEVNAACAAAGWT
jgi:hypothetical protein